MSEYKEDDIVEISLVDVIKSIFQHMKMIVLVTFFAAALAVVYLVFATPIYKSEVSIMVNPIQNSGSMESMLSSAMGSDNGKISTEVELLSSVKTLETALNSLDLSKYSSNGKSYLEREFKTEDLPKLITVELEKDTRLVKISVEDADPNFACDFANAVASSYKLLLSEIVKTAKTNQRIALEKQIPENRVLMDQARAELLDYQNKYGTVEARGKLGSISQYIASLQLLDAPLVKQREELSASIPSDVDIEELRKKPEVESALKDYASTAQEYYYYQGPASAIDDRVYALSSELSYGNIVIQRALSPYVSDSVLASNITQLLAVDVRMATLAKIREQYKDTLSEYQVLLSKEDELSQNVALYQELLLSLSQMLEETKMVESAAAGDLSVIDEARVAEEPCKPAKLKVLAIAILGGGFISVAIAVLLGFMDRGVYSEEDIKNALDESVLEVGWIPFNRGKKGKVLKDLELSLPVLDQDSYIAERYRMITTNIGLLDKKAKVMVVTSSDIGEGKSSVTCNIGITFANIGKKVLIIDGDLRRPELERKFAIAHVSKGLSDVMKGTPVKDCIVRPIESVPNLHLLTAGHSMRNPNVVYSSDAFADMLKELKKVYDYIFIDCPPISFGSDFMLLSENIDSYAYVIRAGVCTKDALVKLKKGSGLIKANLLGYIFYGVIDSSKSFGYGYGYGYGYGSASKKEKKYRNVKAEYKKIHNKELKAREKLSHKFGTKVAQFAFAGGTSKAFGDISEKAIIKTALDNLSAIENDPQAKGKGKTR